VPRTSPLDDPYLLFTRGKSASGKEEKKPSQKSPQNVARIGLGLMPVDDVALYGLKWKTRPTPTARGTNETEVRESVEHE
jgi:hypothetical protein